MKTNRDSTGRRPRGIVNQCGAGKTPWGTYLTTEENFNGYFWEETNGASENITDEQAANNERYGVGGQGFGYLWATTDDLWRADLDPNRPNTFGYMVEIDPYNPGKAPMKHSALGRFKHEGAAFLTAAGGEVVVYMGDDQRFDYIYKFVSDRNYKSMLSEGKSPLDEGKLYCARFDDDGCGEWLELTIENPDLAAAFKTQEEVLTYARMAADVLGATPMDRPEWTTVGPGGEVFCTLTNNSRRTEPNAANPKAPNPNGHIIKWIDTDNHAGERFQWEIVRFADDSIGTDFAFGSADGLWADPAGRLFIQTDGDQPEELNNQMLVSNTEGVIKRLFSGVAGDEITGVALTKDQKTMFINIQHPGNGDPTLTNFPAPTDGVTVPRDATIVIRRKDRGVIGS